MSESWCIVIFIVFIIASPSASSSEQLTSDDRGDGHDLATTATTSGSVPSSAWSAKRREMYDSFTPDEQALFDELQQEIDFLKQLLAKRDKKAAEKVSLFVNLAAAHTL